MFELSSGDRRRAPHRSSIPVLISTAPRVIVLGVLLVIPILYVSAELPEVPACSRSSCRRLRLHCRPLLQLQHLRSRRRLGESRS
jgi:hypothetical protein